MTRTAALLLSLGAAVFVALLAWQGAGAVAAALATAGWGLALVAVFHVLPLLIDAAAIAVLIEGPASFFNALRARWVGESVNSLLPAGQIGGPVLMARHLAQRGLAMQDAAAAVTVWPPQISPDRAGRRQPSRQQRVRMSSGGATITATAPVRSPSRGA